jgi:nucleotide-binding universal stress UspA family protein
MYKSLLIPTDGSELAGKAVRNGIALAKAIGAKITVLTVSAPYHIFTLETTMVEYTPEEYRKYTGDRAAKILGEAASTAKAAGVPCETVHVEQEHVHQAIIDIAAAKGCDLITMASHGRGGLAAIVLGSVTVKVLTHSRLPVLVHR